MRDGVRHEKTWEIALAYGLLPDDRDPPTEAGIEGLEAFPRSDFAQRASPFRWRAILEDSAARRTDASAS